MLEYGKTESKMKKYSEFEPIPFWFLNDSFNEKEVSLQLDIMKENGINAFFLHTRDGITDEAYGTSVFFENVRYIVKESAKRNLKVWLYDEDSFPSGNAGGSIVADFPELQAYSLTVEKIGAEEIREGIARKVLGNVRGLYGYYVYSDENGEKADKITDCFGPVRRRWYRKDMDKTYYCDMQNKLFYNHIRAATSYTEIMFEAKAKEGAEIYAAYLKPVYTDCHYGTQADCLNRKTTEEFIKRTHEKYYESVGDYFGSVIPGIFMDEPSSGGVLPYTDEAVSRFKEKYSYDVTDFYYKLSPEYRGDGKKVRREYINTVQTLFTDNFIIPIKEWCQSRGLMMTGHFYGEEDPLSEALCAQSVYRQTKYSDIPGCDIIGKYVGDLDHCALMLGTKTVVSSAAQSGKKKILAECFALSPFNFGYDGMRKTGDWLMAMGVNLLVPHAFHYGYSAYQRCDAGKSFFFQDRLFPEYVKFAGYAGRACKVLSEYEHKNNVLLVLPSGGFSEEVPFPMLNTGVFPSERAKAMQNRCYEAIRYLTENQINFDIADVGAIAECKVNEGVVKIEKAAYLKTIVTAGGEEENEAFSKLKNEGADCLLFYGDSFKGFPEGGGFKEDHKNVVAYKKRKENGELVFLYQNDKNFAEFEMPVNGNAYVYDAENDEYKTIKSENGYIKLGIKGYGSAIVVTGEKPTGKISGVYSYVNEGERKIECEENPEWTYMPEGAVYALTRYDVTITENGETVVFGNKKFARLRELIGTQDEIYSDKYVIPYFDTAPRPKKIYPVKASYKAYVPFMKKAGSILFDGGTLSGDYKILFNGKAVKKSEIVKRRVYDAKNYVFTPEWNENGENVIEILFENGGEFDGVSGEIYII